MRRIISICKEVPLLPIAIIAAIPLALLGSWRPWEAVGVSLTFGPFNPCRAVDRDRAGRVHDCGDCDRHD